MDEVTQARLFGWREAFADPVTVWLVGVPVGLLLVGFILVWGLLRMGVLGGDTGDELKARLKTWLVLLPAFFVPVLAGGFWTVLAVGVLSVLCYREFARATGLFRWYLVSGLVVLGILLITAAELDHWYGLFVALPALGVISIAGLGVLSDEPKGYIQRTALGVFGFLLFGACLGHLGYLANDADYRPMVLLLLASVELNDVFAYLSGKLVGRRKLLAKTSPNKTIGGALGAVVLTTGLMVVLGRGVFAGTAVGGVWVLVGLGLVVSVSGQLGDLVMSSIKRDLGVKDLGTTLPGHGGVLDRFDSLLLAAPAFFHYVGYFNGIGLDMPVRVFTGG